MKKLFTEYGLLALSMFASVAGIILFASVLSIDNASFFPIVENWVNHLL